MIVKRQNDEKVPRIRKKVEKSIIRRRTRLKAIKSATNSCGWSCVLLHQPLSLCSIWYIISSYHIKNDDKKNQQQERSSKNVNLFKLKCLIHIKNKINSTLPVDMSLYLFRLLYARARVSVQCDNHHSSNHHSHFYIISLFNNIKNSASPRLCCLLL